MTNGVRAGLLMTLAACGAPPATAPADAPARVDEGGAPPTTFVAFAPDFAGYRSWSSVAITDDAGAGEPAHLGTQLIEYINVPRPSEGAPFPVGTIVVKESATGDPTTPQAFAMAKRGGEYNAGLAGWEWFELQNADAGGPQILWRGTAPPNGEMYSGDVNGDCDTCHAKAPHDGVFAL